MILLKRDFGAAMPVWSRSSTADADRRFFPGTKGMLGAGIKAVLVALFLFDSTGAIKIEVGYQEADDNDSWPDAATFTVIPAFSANADGPTIDDAWNNVTLTKKYVRFGFVVKNDTGSARELAWVALRLDTRAC